jgi:hypothetical protein
MAIGSIKVRDMSRVNVGLGCGLELKFVLGLGPSLGLRLGLVLGWS